MFRHCSSYSPLSPSLFLLNECCCGSVFLSSKLIGWTIMVCKLYLIFNNAVNAATVKLDWQSTKFAGNPPLSLCLSLCHFESKILFANFHIICGIFLRKNTLLTSWFVSVSSRMIWWNQPLYNWTFSICIQHEMWCVLEIQPQLMFSATEIMQCFVAEYKMKCGYNVDNSIISASQTEWNLPK